MISVPGSHHRKEDPDGSGQDTSVTAEGDSDRRRREDRRVDPGEWEEDRISGNFCAKKFYGFFVDAHINNNLKM
jgi:hypothetical protein